MRKISKKPLTDAISKLCACKDMDDLAGLYDEVIDCLDELLHEKELQLEEAESIEERDKPIKPTKILGWEVRCWTKYISENGELSSYPRDFKFITKDDAMNAYLDLKLRIGISDDLDSVEEPKQTEIAVYNFDGEQYILQ